MKLKSVYRKSCYFNLSAWNLICLMKYHISQYASLVKLAFFLTKLHWDGTVFMVNIKNFSSHSYINSFDALKLQMCLLIKYEALVIGFLLPPSGTIKLLLPFTQSVNQNTKGPIKFMVRFLFPWLGVAVAAITKYVRTTLSPHCQYI